MPQIPTHTATRYLQPLREGGSLPAVVETEADGLFVVKFRGAGQGARALLAELIAGLVAAELELPIPEVALVEVLPPLGHAEPDPEIQDILRRSHGLNVGLRYLDGAFNFAPAAAGDLVSAELAARVVWFDALLTNPDRSHRNPNLLVWNREPWLIDHGAALYAHHNWSAVDEARTRTPFAMIRDHVLLTRSGDLVAADDELAPRLSPERLRDLLARLPEELLLDPVAERDTSSADEVRQRYLDYLSTRLRSPRPFLDEAVRARERALREPPRYLSARR